MSFEFTGDRQVLEDLFADVDAAELERLRRASLRLRPCAVCGDGLSALHRYARFCSPRCRQRASLLPAADERSYSSRAAPRTRTRT